MPTPSQLLYEGALKLAHNLQTKDQASRFDGDQAARMVMLIGRLTHEDDSTSAIDAFEDLIRIRKRVLRVKLTV